MSQYYQMDLTVRGLKNKTEVTAVAKAIDDLWNWEEDGMSSPDPSKDDGTLEFFITGRGNIYGGQEPEELHETIAAAVWEAIKHFAEVNLRATYLEQIPYDEYDTDEDVYYRWLDGKGYLDNEEELKVRTAGLNPELENPDES